MVGAHGLKGQLRVRFFGDDADDLASAERLILAETEAGAGAVEHRVSSVAAGRRGELRVVLEGLRGPKPSQDFPNGGKVGTF